MAPKCVVELDRVLYGMWQLFFSAKKIPSRYILLSTFLLTSFKMMLVWPTKKYNTPWVRRQQNKLSFVKARLFLSYIICIYISCPRSYWMAHYKKTVVRLEIMSHGNNFKWLVKKCWLGCTFFPRAAHINVQSRLKLQTPHNSVNVSKSRLCTLGMKPLE